MAGASSSTPLAKEATWTSEVQRRLAHHSRIDGTVFADVAGTLHVEQSSDGEHWDVDKEVEVKVKAGQSFSVALTASYWRLRYVNGAKAQEKDFRLSASARPPGAGL